MSNLPASGRDTAGQASSATPASRHAASGAELTWDDALDKQIALAGEAVWSAQDDWSVSADAANSIRYGIRQMEKDVQGSRL